MYARTRTLNLKVVVIVTYFCNKSIFHNQFSCHNYTECQKVCKYHPLMSFNQFKTSYPTKCKKRVSSIFHNICNGGSTARRHGELVLSQFKVYTFNWANKPFQLPKPLFKLRKIVPLSDIVFKIVLGVATSKTSFHIATECTIIIKRPRFQNVQLTRTYKPLVRGLDLLKHISVYSLQF